MLLRNVLNFTHAVTFGSTIGDLNYIPHVSKTAQNLNHGSVQYIQLQMLACDMYVLDY